MTEDTPYCGIVQVNEEDFVGKDAIGRVKRDMEAQPGERCSVRKADLRPILAALDGDEVVERVAEAFYTKTSEQIDRTDLSYRQIPEVAKEQVRECARAAILAMRRVEG